MTFLDIITQFWQELTARPDGPLAFRFVLQPVVAIGLAIRDGISDAKRGRVPYLWTVLFHPAERADRLREGWQATMRVLLLAVAMDIAYQLIVLRALRPLETVVIAFALGFLPYLLVRGPVTRIARRLTSPEPAQHHGDRNG
jgi:hypothetical protein